MKFLVTGASGFLGKELMSLLTRNGHKVVVVGRNPSSYDNKLITVHKADITDLRTLQSCREQHRIEGIIHLAAAVPKNKDEDQAGQMSDVNVRGTVNLFEVFGDSLLSFVYASTAEVYGLPQTKGPIGEDASPLPLSFYGASKLSGEHFARVYANRLGISVAALRFTVLYGPGDTIARAVPNFINQALRGQELQVYGGEELRDYLHVTDAVNAVYLAATKRADGVFNIGTGKGISIKDTAQTIARAVNPELAVRILPREKKAADIVLDVHRASEAFGFTAEFAFPDKLDEQIAWHKQHEDIL
jgi:UDP-glucose 4-epimerase